MTSPKPPAGRANWAALITVAILVIAAVWITQAIVAHNKLQNCIDSGRRDCLPVAGGESKP